MDKLTMTETIIGAKISKGLTWETMGNDLGMSPVWQASACLGMNSAKPDQAKAIAEYLGLSAGVATALEVFPTKTWEKSVPQDPLILPPL